jgi:hypothetical protein
MVYEGIKKRSHISHHHLSCILDKYSETIKNANKTPSNNIDTMHRTKHSIPRRESQVNASWPDINERECARLNPSCGRLTPPKSKKSALPSLRRPNRKVRDISKSLEVKEKLFARVQISELLKSLRTDRFVGQVNLASHAVYMDSPGNRVPYSTSASDATSVCSSLSSEPTEERLPCLPVPFQFVTTEPQSIR